MRLPFLLHQLAKTGRDKFAVLFNLFVGQRAERIEECSSCSFVGLNALVSYDKATATLREEYWTSLCIRAKVIGLCVRHELNLLLDCR